MGQLREFFWSDPLMAIAIAAAIVAFATTPIAFAVLGRLEWFQARRGRIMMRPTFASIVVGMLLVMGIPAIFTALVVKSRYFDKNRYEFDPNRTLSVLDQGREFETLRMSESLYKADEAVRAEMQRLATERKNLVENVKKLDEAMLTLRAASSQSPAVAQTIPNVLERLAGVRRSVGLDGPQQLMDFKAPPASLPAAPAVASAPVPQPAVMPTVAVPNSGGAGLSPVEISTELSGVPEAQKPLAAMLPLSGLPAGWEVGKGMGSSGKARLETFTADNLFEKIDGRAESFLQYGVKGMAYTFYHPTGDESSEAQLYIFDMSDPLKALGKYGSEKPEGAKPLEIGSEGYTSAGSTFFYAGKYYTQIVATKDDPKLSTFILDLAKRVAAIQKPGGASPAAPSPAQAPVAAKMTTDPNDLLKVLPSGSGKASPKYVPQDVFGYSFLSDVFMADYAAEGTTWQGFLRSYETPAAAKAVFEKYLDTAKKDGAQIKKVDDAGVAEFVVATNSDVGLTDVVFLKGNVVGGANGATNGKPAEAFAREFAKALPASLPYIQTEKEPNPQDAKGEGL